MYSRCVEKTRRSRATGEPDIGQQRSLSIVFLSLQISQLIRDNPTYLFEFQRQEDAPRTNDNEPVALNSLDESHQQLLEVHKKQVS
jgi:hypothetical protein